jgi:hypothetical protein
MFNILLRDQAKKHSSYIYKKIDRKYIIYNEIKKYVRIKNPELIRYIIRSAEYIRDIRPFWNHKKQNLEIIIINIKYSYLFFIFSAADLQ